MLIQTQQFNIFQKKKSDLSYSLHVNELSTKNISDINTLGQQQSTKNNNAYEIAFGPVGDLSARPLSVWVDMPYLVHIVAAVGFVTIPKCSSIWGPPRWRAFSSIRESNCVSGSKAEVQVFDGTSTIDNHELPARLPVLYLKWQRPTWTLAVSLSTLPPLICLERYKLGTFVSSIKRHALVDSTW